MRRMSEGTREVARPGDAKAVPDSESKLLLKPIPKVDGGGEPIGGEGKHKDTCAAAAVSRTCFGTAEEVGTEQTL